MFNFFRSRQKKVFCVIDDNDDVTKVLAMELKKHFDVNIIRYTDSVKALNEIKSSKVVPSVVVCDVKMPELDGFTLREKLNQEKIRIPFIFVTGLEGDDIETDDYIVCSKPIDMKQLVENIRKVFNV